MAIDPVRATQDLELRIKRSSGAPGSFDAEVCVVKRGPRAYKTVSLMTFPDPATGEVRKRELRAQTWNAKVDGPGYDFTQTEHQWHIENHEIEALREFLNGQLGPEGRYTLVAPGTELADLLARLSTGGEAVREIVGLLAQAERTPALLDALAGSLDTQSLLAAVRIHKRRAQLAALRETVSQPTATENDIHSLLKTMCWIFGGRYVGEATRRQLTSEDIVDVPLVRADGALHVVELKQANIADLVTKHRKHLIVGKPVHEAVGQAANYLRALDEERATILAKHKIECRRASATVLIGHPGFMREPLPAEDLASTLRTYNSHLARIEVMHYGELIDAAERSLALAEKADDEDPS